MTIMSRRPLLAAATALAFAPAIGPARAADAVVIEAQVDAALVELQRTVPGAETLLERAEGALILPDIAKGGFIVGAQYGEGALRVGGVTEAFYTVAGGSFGLQAGVETFSQALLFMTPEALDAFRTAQGWEAGVDAEVTVLTHGFDAGADTTVTNQPVIGLIFGQTGLLAGASLQGSKYTRVER